MGTMSEWLKIMLGEVARKQEESSRAVAEQKLRQEGSGTGSSKTATGQPV